LSFHAALRDVPWDGCRAKVALATETIERGSTSLNHAGPERLQRGAQTRTGSGVKASTPQVVAVAQNFGQSASVAAQSVLFLARSVLRVRRRESGSGRSASSLRLEEPDHGSRALVAASMVAGWRRRDFSLGSSVCCTARSGLVMKPMVQDHRTSVPRAGGSVGGGLPRVAVVHLTLWCSQGSLPVLRLTLMSRRRSKSRFARSVPGRQLSNASRTRRVLSHAPSVMDHWRTLSDRGRRVFGCRQREQCCARGEQHCTRSVSSLGPGDEVNLLSLVIH
jgi:hypothetical protein